ncbi:MAG: hypothetical protein BSOLF_1822 [Candidatus Carbobacillus altaicus]|uniref:Uncharacterized protein n=1 Tax=Candidatus Carbonibacillus altaicus TaxID=2163959 RepID=A0A2R6XYT6_9BACL|nr:MAG: hypothetical protein BSOLF_1822 [Candidatus Carbobacillus altaicus]
MKLRDKNRYRLKDHRERTIQTLFGEVTFQRRLYEDRTTGQTVYLLDQYLSMEKRKPMSPPYLEEWAIRLAAEGTSYRKAANFLEEWFGKRVLSHETIRQKLIERGMSFQEEAPIKEEIKPKKDVLFVEVNGIHTSIQPSKRKSKEHRIALVHQGWEKRGYRSPNKTKMGTFVTYIQNNAKYHRDYRNLLKALGKEMSTYQPMGGSEATVRLFARRIKSGGYSSRIPGVESMIQVFISLKTTGRIPGERGTRIDDIKQIEQNRKAHAKERITRSVQKIKEMGKGVVQGALPYLANTSRTHPMHQARRGLKKI